MSEYETIINKIDLLTQKLDLYKQTSDQQIKSINTEIKAYQDANKQQLQAINAEIKAYQDANKQQLNVSLGVLITAAVAILVSVIISN